MNYYNEHDRKCAECLRELIAEKLIPNGYVDERDIKCVTPKDIKGFKQCHFFAGIGGWSFALQLAGIPKDEKTWTASCPCQPFSPGATNTAKGQSDDRDLWPTFFELFRKCKPPRCLGEQTAQAINWGWWDRAKMDIESISYAAAATIMQNHPFGGGGGDERKRIYWIADANGQRRERFIKDFKLSKKKKKQPTFSVFVDHHAITRKALDGHFDDILPCDGFSVAVARDIIKGFGNAINPITASKFIEAAWNPTNEEHEKLILNHE